MAWNPFEDEIDEWMNEKEYEFLHKETRDLHVNPLHWKQRYIDSDLREIFLQNFHVCCMNG